MALPVEESSKKPPSFQDDLPSIYPCNGDVRYCYLRYDQYTFAGSHNSGAYDLSFDCSTALGMIKFMCYKGIPHPLMNCLWNNMANRNLLRQLRDGIRALDLDTCQVDDRTVLCHGEDRVRALGEELPDAFSQIRQFLEENPFEVVTIEFGDNDGDPRVNAPNIASKLEEHLGDYLYHHRCSQWLCLGRWM
ncbi:PLC-like phosphodiesterase [Piptocephalis cylindrospora]|uniref:PLC-like phosphodiesterase n=1 Tax=Piptocephalis cylindrospora TaxID=1907219 RepID=A0A4P9Y1N6_9FUNG|nr:PLC-like phosphodiesterase [Piptocephalis cylindrospora]|eukprot:RKP11981.1 PLC-like phosphodiesterase [Piptocephalis cylindrospora]